MIVDNPRITVPLKTCKQIIPDILQAIQVALSMQGGLVARSARARHSHYFNFFVLYS